MMAPTDRRRGIAIATKATTRRFRSDSRNNSVKGVISRKRLPAAYRNGQWPLKGILRAKGKRYLVDWADHPHTGETFGPTWARTYNLVLYIRFADRIRLKEHRRDVGTKAIKEWEADKGKPGHQHLDSPESYTQSHNAATSSHTPGVSTPRSGRRGLKLLADSTSLTSSLLLRQRGRWKQKIIPSSPSSIEIPETQSEPSPDPRAISVEIDRPADFNSQDWSTLASSQVESLLVTKDTSQSYDITKTDPTLGSSLPPDSPVGAAADNSASQEPASQTLLQYLPSISRSQEYCAASFCQGRDRELSCVDSLDEIYESRSSRVDLLVARSDPVDEPETVPSSQAPPPQTENPNHRSPSIHRLTTVEKDLNTQTPPSESSGWFDTQISLPDNSQTESVSLPLDSRVRSTEPPSSPTFQRTASAGPISTPSSSLLSYSSLPPSPASPGSFPSDQIKQTMPDSQQTFTPSEGSPSVPSEWTPQPDLRDKLRHIRATARANCSARSISRADPANSISPSTEPPEKGDMRRSSPELTDPDPAAIHKPGQDQAIPSLESNDDAVGNMEVDKEGIEASFRSALPSPPAVASALATGTVELVPDHEADKTTSELEIPTLPLLKPHEFVVPLPIDGRIKHQYLTVFAERWKDIGDFLHSPKSQRLFGVMTDLIRRLNDTVVHTDLGLDGPPAQGASTTEEVEWAEVASSKFAFLGQIIRILSGSELHIVLTARGGPTLDLLRTYLKGKAVNYRQDTGSDLVEDLQQEDGSDPMRYTILSTRMGAELNIPRSASLIIALDDSLQASMLPEWSSTNPSVPVLRLLVVNSAEHVGLCVPSDLSEPERLRRLVEAAVHVHKEVGEMPLRLDFRHAVNLHPGARLAMVKKDLGAKIAHAAAATAGALDSGNFAANFTLESISELDIGGLADQPPRTEISKGLSSSSSRAGTPLGQKRLREDQSSTVVQSKRQRLTPGQDSAQISDLTDNSQSRIDSLKVSLKKAQQDASDERKARIKAEESATYLQSRLNEIEKSLGGLQHRYERRVRQVRDLRVEKEKTVAERETESRRLDKTIAENISLKDERAQLREDIRTARDALKNSTLPTVAELEMAREAARAAKEEAAQLQKSNTNIRKDFEFTRTQYQDASTKAAEHASQVTELEGRIAELKRQASEERRRLAELNLQEARKQDLARIEELEAERNNRETVMQRLEEENKALRRGRGVVTRSSSAQPGAGGGGGGPVSRGASPAPGGLLGPSNITHTTNNNNNNNNNNNSHSNSNSNNNHNHIAHSNPNPLNTVNPHHTHPPLGGRASALRNER